MSRRVTAIPWLEHVECGTRRIPVDMHIEDYGTGILPPKYERKLEEFFKTTDKRMMLNKFERNQRTPILCPGNIVEIVDKDSGDMMKRVAIKGKPMKKKLVYGNIPKGRFGADDGVVNVCLNKRFAKIAKSLCMSEGVVQNTVSGRRKMMARRRMAYALAEQDAKHYLNQELNRAAGTNVRDVKFTWVYDSGLGSHLLADIEYAGRNVKVKGWVAFNPDRGKFTDWQLALPSLQIGNRGVKMGSCKTAMSLSGNDVKAFLNNILGKLIGARVEQLKLKDMPGANRGEDAKILAELTMGQHGDFDVEGTITVKDGQVTDWNIELPYLLVNHFGFSEWSGHSYGGGQPFAIN